MKKISELNYLYKIIIFAQPRTGSTTLTRILNIHSNINIAFEPFNNDENIGIAFSTKYFDDNYEIKCLEEKNQLFHWVHQYPLSVFNKVLEEIHKTFNGIKHLSYALPYDMNYYLLSQAQYKIVFLTRRNLLQQVVSDDISLQSGEWVTNKQKVMETQYSPINVQQLKNKIDKFQQESMTYKTKLRDINHDFLEIYYEDLFGFDLPLESKLDKINQILAYLELGWFETEAQVSQVKDLLNPKKRKLNSCETYLLIPNIFEVEEKLGCEETGYLFSQETNTYFSLGNQLQREGKLEQSIGAYQCSAKHNPNFYATYHNLGEVLSRQGHLQESIAAYWRAIELNPNSALSYYQLAEILEKQGCREEAISAYRQAVVLNSSCSTLMRKIVWCCPHGGLNDMLVQINKCRVYAQKYDRDLWIDTSRSGFLDCFSHYFEPSQGLYFGSPLEIYINASCFPAVLSNGSYQPVCEKETGNWVDKATGSLLTFDFEIPYDEVILVHEKPGGGLCSINTLKLLKLKQHVKQEIKCVIEQLGQYDAIHIRNTDYRTDYRAFFKHLKPVINNKVIVCTDSFECQQYAKDFWDNQLIIIYNIPDVKKTTGRKILHYNTDLDRYETNLAALKDLFILACAQNFYSTTTDQEIISGFARLATLLRSHPEIINNLLDITLEISSKKSIDFDK